MPNSTEENNEKLKPWMVWAIAIAVCLFVWGCGAVLTRLYAVNCASTFDNETAGLFGDSFGAVNALISALAFAGVIVTFRLQRKELDLQRHELNLQYQELKAQRDEFAQQNMTLKLQRFENTFFNMMQLQQQIVNDLHLQVAQRPSHGNIVPANSPTKELNGREVIRYIYDKVRLKVSFYGIEYYADVKERDLLDHYFRHLYTILRFVDESDTFASTEVGQVDRQVEWKQKYHYTTIIRATLSRYEMLILYYNGLSEFGCKKLKPLIEKYALLDNVDIYHLAISREFKEVIKYDQSFNDQWFSQYDLTGRDYEFFLTEEENNPLKYNIRAFGFGDEDMECARQSIRNFNRMLEARKKVEY